MLLSYSPRHRRSVLNTVQNAVDQSALAKLADICFIPDGPTTSGIQGAAGFDCDDYALVMANYLGHVLPDSYGTGFVAVSSDSVGHAMVVLQSGSDFVVVDPQFVVDPQYGRVTSPVTSLAAAAPLVEKIMHGDYKKIGSFTLTAINSPTYQNPSFMVNPDMVMKFIENLKKVTANDP